MVIAPLIKLWINGKRDLESRKVVVMTTVRLIEYL
jgi:hypothetical protein